MSDTNGKVNDSRDEMLDRVQTAGAVSLPPHLFEQLYLGPKTPVHGKLRQTFGNPTPVAIGGFLLCTTPLSMVLFGWQGAGGFGGAANVASYIYFGGIFLTLGGIGEWIIGNTFPSTVFCLFGGFWLTFGNTIVPANGAYGTYSTDGSVAEGLTEPQFFATLSFFLVGMSFLCTVFTIASLRTNIVFFGILLFLVPTFGCLAGSFFAVSHGQAEYALTLQHAGAGLLLVASILGWYIFLALLLLAVDFPIGLPVGDLSTVIPAKKKESDSEV